MTRKTIAAVLLLGAALASCRRGPSPSAPVRYRTPSGDGVWFEEGVDGADAELEGLVERSGFSWVILPWAKLARGENRWIVSRRAASVRPFTRLPVSLVIETDAAALAVLTSGDTSTRLALENALGQAAREALDGAGAANGIHFDFPFSPDSAAAFAKVLRGVKRRLPSGVFLSVTVRSAVSGPGRGKWLALARAADGMVAMVWGLGDAAEPAATDAFATSWWAGYAPGARGWSRDRSGVATGPYSDDVLARLSDERDLEFRHDMTIFEPSLMTFLLAPHRPVAAAARTFRNGDVVSFRQPSVKDMVSSVRGDGAGRKFLRGRVLAVPGRSEAERLFPITAWKDVRSGKTPLPALRVSLASGPGFVDLSAENASPHASGVSRTNNWIELDLAVRRLREVRPGGFDRFDLAAGSGRATTPGRASRVLFYETLIGPFEKIEPARIVLAGPLSAGCCRYRVHLLASTGEEITTDWTETASVREPGNAKRESN